ncbi:MAG: outer membrane lipoprotein-sorting protein [Opitutales bacterium]
MRPLRLISFAGLLACFAFAAVPDGLLAQSRGRIPPNLRDPARLDEAEGARVLEAFRRLPVAGDFVYAIELVHEPRRAPTRVYEGFFSGGWHDGLRTRLDLRPADEDAGPQRFLQWNGADPRLWTYSPSHDATSEARSADAAALHESVLPGLALTPFDLQMPFLYWPDYAYEGSGRLKGRGVHHFLLYPPSEDPRYTGIGAVRVAIEENFNVAMRVETLDEAGEVTKRFEVQAVKKVGDQWIVRRIDFMDRVSGDRTRLVVTAAQVESALPPSLLTPDGLAQPLPEVPLEPL